MAINPIDRRELIRRAGAFGTMTWLTSIASAGRQNQAGRENGERTRRRGDKLPDATPNARKLGWRMACQMYTFRDRSFYETLPILEKLGVRGVEPCFFLPLSKDKPDLKTSEALSVQMRREMKKRLSDHGIRMVSYYAPLGGDTEAFGGIFEFAKEMGVRTLVAEPPAEVFDKIEALCNEYEISLAIHNHPKGPNSKYWRPEDVLAVCKDRGERIGACADTGHYVRSGLDPVESLRKLKGRIVAMHLKDVAEWGKPEARDVPLGTGKANYAEVLKELRSQKWRGITTIEYEHLSDKLVEDVARCVKFVEDFAASIQAKGGRQDR